MKKILLLMTVVVFGTAYSALADPCDNDTLADYIADGSCTMDGITFSNFAYNPTSVGGAVVPPAGSVNVDPITMGSEFGFDFTAGWAAGPGQSEDSKITYTATCDSTCSITDLELSIAGAAASGNSFVNVAETIPTPAESLGVGVTGGGTKILDDKVTFSPGVNSIDLTKDIHVNGGSTGIGASVSGVDNLFSTTGGTTMTPEPSLLILCTGLLGLLPFARRKFVG